MSASEFISSDEMLRQAFHTIAIVSSRKKSIIISKRKKKNTLFLSDVPEELSTLRTTVQNMNKKLFLFSFSLS